MSAQETQQAAHYMAQQGKAMFQKGRDFLRPIENTLLMREQWGKPFSILGDYFTKNQELHDLFNANSLESMPSPALNGILHFFGAKNVNELRVESTNINKDKGAGSDNKYCYSISGKGRKVEYFTHIGHLTLNAKQDGAERTVLVNMHNKPDERTISDTRRITKPGEKEKAEERHITMGHKRDSKEILTIIEDQDNNSSPKPVIWAQPDESLKQLLAS